MPRDADRIPYFKINKLVWKWKLCEGDDGGIPVCDVGLSMAMAPPVKESPVKPSTPVVRADKRDSLDKMVDDIERIVGAFSRFKKWLDTPDPPQENEGDGKEKRSAAFRYSANSRRYAQRAYAGFREIDGAVVCGGTQLLDYIERPE